MGELVMGELTGPTYQSIAPALAGALGVADATLAVSVLGLIALGFGPWRS